MSKETTDTHTELLLFFYIQKRIEMVSEELGFLYNARATIHSKEDFDENISTVDEKQQQLDILRTKRDALIDRIEGGDEADC